MVNKKHRIIVALSGGVDSSVAAFLLKKSGHEVIGLYMRNWHDSTLTKDHECPWIEDSNYALEVANQIGIPFQVLDLSKEYKERIVNYMINSYGEGLTPNPDILCNKKIKFDVFLNYALKLKADYIATGHYCIKEKKNQSYIIKQGKDKIKDQTYFLCQINQLQLAKSLFPIGELSKQEVRDIAQKNNLVTANKKDSQGLCFVGKIKLPIFLQNQLKPKKGRIIEIESNSKIYKNTKDDSAAFSYKAGDGKEIGIHNGAHFFTIGQRKGLEIGGQKEPLFVISTNVKENIVFVGMGQNHPGLFRQSLALEINKTHWIREDTRMKISEKKEYKVRIRHRQALQDAVLELTKSYLFIRFKKPQRAIAKGQFATWYSKNELIGSGPIN
ncbi:tRNA 2-thiouridine(34) synthase MnmA [Flavobacteriales bacterium]|nr:tRNA 2-thiouridine(34) synthase MnmA [Flavobacteriales bacterium]